MSKGSISKKEKSDALKNGIRKNEKEEEVKRFIEYILINGLEMMTEFHDPVSPDFTPLDILLWNFVKDAIFVPFVPNRINR